MKNQDQLVTNLNKLAEVLDYFGSMFTDTAAVARAVTKDMAVIVEEEVKEEKKVKKTKKAAKKKEEPARKVFDKDNPPTTAAEKKLFQEHWKALGEDGQKQYVDGKLDSLGEVLAGWEGDDLLDDLEDLEEPSLSLDDLREKAKLVAKEKGKAAVTKVFKEYGYGKIAEVKDADISKIYGAL